MEALTPVRSLGQPGTPTLCPRSSFSSRRIFTSTGLYNWDRPSHPINNWQKASFFFGLFLVFFALQSPLGPAVGSPAFFPPGAAFHPANGRPDVHTPRRAADPHCYAVCPGWARQGIIRPMARSHYVRQVYNLLTNPNLRRLLLHGKPLPVAVPRCVQSRSPKR